MEEQNEKKLQEDSLEDNKVEEKDIQEDIIKEEVKEEVKADVLNNLKEMREKANSYDALLEENKKLNEELKNIKDFLNFDTKTATAFTTEKSSDNSINKSQEYSKEDQERIDRINKKFRF